MKCQKLLCTFLLSLLLMNLIICRKWKDTMIRYNRMLIRFIIHQDINTKGIEKLIERIDKSMESKDPKGLKDYTGTIRENDILVVTKRLVLWFSLSPKGKRVIRSGGGALAGMWEITLNKKGKASLKNSDKKTGYAPNLLLTGSKPGLKLFGTDVFGSYEKVPNISWGIEYSKDAKATKLTGTDIINTDRGSYSSMEDQGLFIQTQGTLGNSKIGDGIDTDTDTDPRPGVKGETRYTLTYRIPANRLEFITDVEFTPLKGNFGPISNAFVTIYLPGYKNDIVYAANPELIPDNKEQLITVYANKWFRNLAVENTYFYDIKNINHPASKLVCKTPPGKGRILCIGSPLNKIGMICGYPRNDFIPKAHYEEYSLEISDNQTFPKIGKFHTLKYKLLTSPNASNTLKEKEKMSLIMRYKIINATKPLPEVVTPQNSKNLVKVKK